MKILFIFVILHFYISVQGEKPQWHSITKMDSVPASLDLTNVIREIKQSIAYQIQMSVQGVSNNQHHWLSVTKPKSVTAQIKMRDVIKELKRSISYQIQLSLIDYANSGNSSNPIFAQLQPMIKKEIDAKMVEALVDSLDKLNNDIRELNKKDQELNTRVRTLETKIDEINEIFGQSCSIPADILGTTHTTDETDSDGKLSIGGNITYACNSNLVLGSGDLKRTCSFGSFLSGQAPVCKENPCQLPPDVTGSTHMVDGKVNVGVRIVYTCKAGFYHTTGDLERMCNSGQVWSSKAPVCKEDCKRSQNGYEYDGRISTTSSNRQCQRWGVDTPHPHDYNTLDAENYCRNHDRGSDESSPWCYTLDPSKNKEKCTIPTCTTQAKNCKETPSGIDYFGTIDKTKDGTLCQKWSENVPHSHDYVFLSDQENYCRNAFNEEPDPWCYTADTNIRWQHCNVPSC